MPDLIQNVPERPRAPEGRPEQAPAFERPRPAAERPATEKVAPTSAVAPVVPATTAAIPSPAKDPMTKRIETILEEDLSEVYFKMTPEQQVAFKKKGEETGAKIKALLAETKIKAKEVVQLIIEWLKLIPGVNKFFLEQEAKIKTDKLLALKK